MFIKLKIRLSVYRKTYIIFENGVWGVAPSGVRAAAPHSAPFRGKGGLGIGIEDEQFFEKTYFFYKLQTFHSYSAKINR